MPQLDFFILTSQFHLIFIFIIGYLLFIKHLLPNAAFVLKSNNRSSIAKFNLFSKLSLFLKSNSFIYDAALFNNANLLVISKFYSFKDTIKLNISIAKKCLKG